MYTFIMEKKVKVLLVEDEPELRDLYRELLSLEYEVEVAKDGEEGLVMLAKGGFSVVLLDMMMPKLDGVGFLTKRKTMQGLNSIPVIVMSNLRQDEVVKECFALGAKYYIQKADITPDKIVAVLSEIMGKK